MPASGDQIVKDFMAGEFWKFRIPKSVIPFRSAEDNVVVGFMAVDHEIQKCPDRKLFSAGGTETVRALQGSSKDGLGSRRQGTLQRLSNGGGTAKISQLQVQVPVKKTIACM